MPDSRVERPRFCSQCGDPVVVSDASFCKNCGAPLAATVWFSHDITWRPIVAIALSIIPGLGHWYKGQPGRGLAWFTFVIFLYAAAAPIAYVVHLICAGNAGLGGAIREEAIANSARHNFRRRRWERARRRSRRMVPQPPAA
ncbi:MAG TPA: zinc ribbon domain-containing protein [Candidatus Binataceae bacterium]|nr:zinc ribbon domain-containing protein [Candidatus Binataceae bacterium]